MNIKSRGIPLELLQLEALLRRISVDHPKRELIAKAYGNKRAGLFGEMSMEYPLSFISREKYHIFHDLRLKNKLNDHYFQMDTLVVSQNFILLLESKNFSGTLYFDSDLKQMIRTTHEGKEEGYPCPIIQAEHQEYQLRLWLEKEKLPSLPVISFVVITNPQTVIKASHPQRIANKVIRNNFLFTAFRELERKFEKEIISKKELKKISSTLYKHHSPSSINILDKYSIPSTDIKKGVQCPKCRCFSMIRVSANWFCPACNFVSKNAHIEALKDYCLLMDHWISNGRAREFLQVESIVAMNYIFSTLRLEHQGERKARKYNLSSLLKLLAN